MTPILWCEYIVATALGLSAAVFILACLAALIKWLFIKPDPDDDDEADEYDDGEERPADFKATSKAAAAAKDAN